MRPDAHALLAAYATDAVDADERRDVDAHLAVCETCTTDLVDLRETLAGLAELAAEPPPPQMRAVVLAAAAATPQQRPIGVRENSRVVRRPLAALAGSSRVMFTLAASFAALTVLGAASTGVLWQRLGDVNQDRVGTAAVLAAADGSVLRAPVDLPADLDGSLDAGDLVVVASPSTNSAVLVTSGLPDAPDGREWQAWYVNDGGARSAGLFDTSGGVVLLEGQLAGAAAVAVTLEPTGGSPMPSTDPVAVVGLSA